MDITEQLERVAKVFEDGAFSLTDASFRALDRIDGDWNPGYAARAYIREQMAPGEYLNDGTRVNPTADEMLAAVSGSEAARMIRALI